jgi:hypothetical protein
VIIIGIKTQKKGKLKVRVPLILKQQKAKMKYLGLTTNLKVLTTFLIIKRKSNVNLYKNL